MYYLYIRVLFKGLFLALHLFGEVLFIVYGFIFVAYILGLTIWGAFSLRLFINIAMLVAM